MTDPGFGRLLGIAAALLAMYATSWSIGRRRSDPGWWRSAAVSVLAWAASLWMLLR